MNKSIISFDQPTNKLNNRSSSKNRMRSPKIDGSKTINTSKTSLNKGH